MKKEIIKVKVPYETKKTNVSQRYFIFISNYGYK